MSKPTEAECWREFWKVWAAGMAAAQKAGRITEQAA
jgi:hypothetical protein